MRLSPYDPERQRRREQVRELWHRAKLSTPEVGHISGETAECARAGVDGRFAKGNPFRWQPGRSGNPRGRPSKGDEYQQHTLTLLDLIGRVTALEWGHVRQRDERAVKFKTLYQLTGNAHRSALVAGYSAKTARSKSYLLARRFAETDASP